jgi:hypothetical protein
MCASNPPIYSMRMRQSYTPHILLRTAMRRAPVCRHGPDNGCNLPQRLTLAPTLAFCTCMPCSWPAHPLPRTPFDHLPSCYCPPDMRGRCRMDSRMVTVPSLRPPCNALPLHLPCEQHNMVEPSQACCTWKVRGRCWSAISTRAVLPASAQHVRRTR